MTTDANAQPQNCGVTTPSDPPPAEMNPKESDQQVLDRVFGDKSIANKMFGVTPEEFSNLPDDKQQTLINHWRSAPEGNVGGLTGMVQKAGSFITDTLGPAIAGLGRGNVGSIARQLTPAAMASDAVLDAHPAFNSDGVLPDISHTPIGRMNRDIGMGVPGAAEVKTYHDPVSGEVHMGVTGPDGKGLAATTDVETPTGRHLHDLHIASGLKGGTVAADLQADRLAAIAQTHPNATITAGTGSPLSDALKDSIDATVMPDGTVVGTAKPQGGYGIPENPDPRALPGAYGTPGSGDLLPIEPPGVVPGPGSAGVEPSGVKMHDVGPRAHPANPIAPGPDNEPTKGK